MYSTKGGVEQISDSLAALHLNVRIFFPAASKTRTAAGVFGSFANISAANRGSPSNVVIHLFKAQHVYEVRPRKEIFVTFREDSSNHTLDDISAASTFCRSRVAPWISCIDTCSNGARAFGERPWLSGLPGHFRCHSHDQIETPSGSTSRGWDYKRVAED